MEIWVEDSDFSVNASNLHPTMKQVLVSPPVTRTRQRG